MLTEKQIEEQLEICRKLKMQYFEKVQNKFPKHFYYTETQDELTQKFAELAESILTIVLGDQSVTIKDMVEFVPASIFNRIKPEGFKFSQKPRKSKNK